MAVRMAACAYHLMSVLYVCVILGTQEDVVKQVLVPITLLVTVTITGLKLERCFKTKCYLLWKKYTVLFFAYSFNR